MTESRVERRDMLVVDDDIYSHDLFEALFEGSEVRVWSAKDGEEGVDACKARRFDLVITDIRMPRMSGIEFLEKLRAFEPDTPVVVITAYGSVDTAVQAMKLGAFDYIEKPFPSPAAIRQLVRRCFEHHDLRRENRRLKNELEQKAPDVSFIGPGTAMQAVFAWVAKIADIDSTVLIRGESGTGKEILARAIHQRSPRRKGEFLPVNCGGLPETLLESTLFGYEKGAFTGAYKTTAGFFEAASGGVLFLDEVESMSAKLQVRLLRVLQERSFFRVGGTTSRDTDARIISASKLDLKAEVDAGRFREDLYYRLNVLSIELPPLRGRTEDIPALTRHFLGRFNRKFGRDVAGISVEAMEALQIYSWPGNVRELENVLERAVALAEERHLTLGDLPPPLVSEVASAEPSGGLMDYATAREQFQSGYLDQLLRAARGNVSQAARLSGIPRQNLYLKLQQADLDAKSYRS